MDPVSSNSLRFSQVDVARINGNINCTVGNKDTGMFSHELKLSQAHLDKKHRKIGM